MNKAQFGPVSERSLHCSCAGACVAARQLCSAVCLDALIGLHHCKGFFLTGIKSAGEEGNGLWLGLVSNHSQDMVAEVGGCTQTKSWEVLLGPTVVTPAHPAPHPSLWCLWADWAHQHPQPYLGTTPP